jgi:nucleoid-associated protein YgaU
LYVPIFRGSTMIMPSPPFADVDRAAGVDAALAAVAGAVGVLCLLWCVVAIAAAVLSALPGVVGRTAESIASRITPALVRRAVAVALGTGLALAPAAYASARVVPTPGPAAVAGTAAPFTVRIAGTVLASLPATPTLPPLDWPATSTDPAAPVVVAPGDTLWAIAARALPPGASDAAIDAEWRRWYAANRSVVGPDPDVIYPGQRLVSPSTDATTEGGAR